MHKPGLQEGDLCCRQVTGSCSPEICKATRREALAGEVDKREVRGQNTELGLYLQSRCQNATSVGQDLEALLS